MIDGSVICLGFYSAICSILLVGPSAKKDLMKGVEIGTLSLSPGKIASSEKRTEIVDSLQYFASWPQLVLMLRLVLLCFVCRLHCQIRNWCLV